MKLVLTFANKITILRILIVPFFVGTVLYYSPQKDYLRYAALGIFLLAAISDIIDGYIARTRGQRTQAGAILDPLADKILLISAFICLYKVGIYFENVRFPVWLVVAVISRDVILLLGAMLIYIVHGHLQVVPSKWGKAATFFQSISIMMMLLQWPFSLWIWYITIFFTIVSVLGYIRNGIKILYTPVGETLPL